MDRADRASPALDAGRFERDAKRPDILPLTSLRFFASASIVAYHLQGPFGYTINANFGAGISFFFVLSGFILTYLHSDLASGRQAVSFYRARIARIWPLHLATLLLVAAIIGIVPLDVEVGRQALPTLSR
jgi:peptidoglycan/LPS O-acetylase OafA/YrhL